MYSARVNVQNSIFSNCVPLAWMGGGNNTKNGLTIAGVMPAQTGSVDDKEDMLIVQGCMFENNKDFGVAIQGRDFTNTIAFGGTISVTNCISKGNKGGGFAIEAVNSVGIHPFNLPCKAIIIANCTSIKDCVGTTVSDAAFMIAYEAHDVILSNIVVESAQRFGVLLNGYKNINIDNVIINGFGLANSDAIGIFVYKGTPNNLEFVTVSKCTVRQGAGTGDNYGMNLTGIIIWRWITAK